MIISIAQIVTAVLIVILILLQERSAGISGLLGGGDSGGFYQTRRGLEKIIFYSTIALIVIFIGLAVYELVY
ncbi:MAG: preprotein translocase subunit SecG [Patescibacteria group bacterium]